MSKLHERLFTYITTNQNSKILTMNHINKYIFEERKDARRKTQYFRDCQGAEGMSCISISSVDIEGTSQAKKPRLVSPSYLWVEYSTNKCQRSPTVHSWETIHRVTCVKCKQTESHLFFFPPHMVKTIQHYQPLKKMIIIYIYLYLYYL